MREDKSNRWSDTVIYVYILKRSFTGIITPYSGSESWNSPENFYHSVREDWRAEV